MSDVSPGLLPGVIDKCRTSIGGPPSALVATIDSVVAALGWLVVSLNSLADTARSSVVRGGGGVRPLLGGAVGGAVLAGKGAAEEALDVWPVGAGEAARARLEKKDVGVCIVEADEELDVLVVAV